MLWCNICSKSRKDTVHDAKTLLEEELTELKLEIDRLKQNDMNIDDRIDNHVDMWFETNNIENDLVGIKVLGFRVIFFTKEFERNIYKKILKIVTSFFFKN